MSASSERLIAMLLGAVFLAALLAIGIAIPRPTDYQFFVFRVVLSVAAAAFMALVPGLLNVEFGPWLRASGAVAVFALIYLVDPAVQARKVFMPDYFVSNPPNKAVTPGTNTTLAPAD